MRTLLIDYPLKQGLKLKSNELKNKMLFLLIDYPLKQGLKPMPLLYSVGIDAPSY